MAAGRVGWNWSTSCTAHQRTVYQTSVLSEAQVHCAQLLTTTTLHLPLYVWILSSRLNTVSKCFITAAVSSAPSFMSCKIYFIVSVHCDRQINEWFIEILTYTHFQFCYCHLSGSNKSTGLVCLAACVSETLSVQAITLKWNDHWPRYLASWQHRGQFWRSRSLFIAKTDKNVAKVVFATSNEVHERIWSGNNWFKWYVLMTRCKKRLPSMIQYLQFNKSVFSFLRQLTAWHCSQLLLSAGRAAIDRYLLPARPTAANPMQQHARNAADRQTPDRYTEPALHTMQAEPAIIARKHDYRAQHYA